MPQPEISVVILSYNHQEYIERAVESVLSQKIDVQYEIIIGEDNSTDNTKGVLENYEHLPQVNLYYTYDNSRKIFIDNRMTGRRNMIDCLQRARGKYIAYLDGDDYWIDDHKLEKQFRLMEDKPECALCYHDCYIEVGGIRKKYPNFYQWEMRDGDLVSQKVLPHSSTIFFRNVGFKDLPDVFYKAAFGDLVLFMYLLSFGTSCYIREKMSVYRINQGSVWATTCANTLYAIGARAYLISQLFPLLGKRYGEFVSEIREASYNNLRRLISITRHEKGYGAFISEYLRNSVDVFRTHPQKIPNYLALFIDCNLIQLKGVILGLRKFGRCV